MQGRTQAAERQQFEWQNRGRGVPRWKHFFRRHWKNQARHSGLENAFLSSAAEGVL